MERIAAFIREAAGAREVTVESASRLSGGAIQENLALDVRIDGVTHALVLRKDAGSAVAVSRRRDEEFALLRAAFAAGVTVPEPLWQSNDPAIAGSPFFIMRRVGGTASARRIVRERHLGGDRATLARRLGAELARIHTIAPPRPDLAFLAAPRVSPARDFIADARASLDAAGNSRPVLEFGLRWLETHAPPADELVLAHHDFRTGNYMLDDAGITGILDWEFAGWSDPHEDVGWFCAWCWRFGADDDEAGGIGSREAFYAGYEAASGRRIDRERVRYWEAFAHARWAVIALQQMERHLSGAEPSLELALTGTIVPELEHELLREIAS